MWPSGIVQTLVLVGWRLAPKLFSPRPDARGRARRTPLAADTGPSDRSCVYSLGRGHQTGIKSGYGVRANQPVQSPRFRALICGNSNGRDRIRVRIVAWTPPGNAAA